VGDEPIEIYFLFFEHKLFLIRLSNRITNNYSDMSFGGK